MEATTPPRFHKRDLIAGLALFGALVTILIVDRLSSATGAEVVFLVDQRPVMKSLRDPIRDRCIETAESLTAQGMQCRFAVVPFGGAKSYLPLIELTNDPKVLREQLAADLGESAPADDTAESAMQRALKWEFREGEPVIFYLISATPWTSADESRGIAKQLSERGIATFIQANQKSQAACQPLLDNGGRFITFDGKEATSQTAAAKPRTRAANLVAKLSSQGRSQFAVGGLYSARTSVKRMEIVEKGGGTTESEAAVAAGLNWLARHQADDGHWADHGKCEPGAPCPVQNFMRGAQFAETGLAILAFQSGGYYDFNGASNQQPHAERYADVVRRGLDWLVEHQDDDGRWFGPGHTGWYQHGIATFAMAEACAVAYANQHEPDPRYLYAAKRAIKFIEVHQYQQGGWQYEVDSTHAGDTSVSGWQALALKSAVEAEIPVDPETLTRVKYFFEKCWNENTGETQYMPRYGSATPLTTAVGLIVQHFIAKTPDSTIATKAAAFLAPKAQTGIGRTGDFYTLYNGNLAMFLAGGDTWTNWNNAVRDEIIQRQEQNGCVRGSWNDSYGRTLGTAWAVLALEVYYRYTPAGNDPKGK